MPSDRKSDACRAHVPCYQRPNATTFAVGRPASPASIRVATWSLSVRIGSSARFTYLPVIARVRRESAWGLGADRRHKRLIDLNSVLRFTFLALVAFGGFGMAGPALAQTATQYPYCIQGEDNPGWSGCSFNTLQECQESASGTFAECLSNPWYKASNSGAPTPYGNQPGS